MHKGRLPRGRTFALAATLLLIAATGRAAERCPWMNRATAGGVLGGEPTSQATRVNDEKDQGSCSYELRGGDAISRLTIEVTILAAPQRDFAMVAAKCGAAATQLKAIGNEAVACQGADAAARWELVVGRVRESAFVLRLSSNEPAVKSEQLRERARKAAELIAGILF